MNDSTKRSFPHSLFRTPDLIVHYAARKRESAEAATAPARHENDKSGNNLHQFQGGIN